MLRAYEPYLDEPGAAAIILLSDPTRVDEEEREHLERELRLRTRL